MDMKYYGTAMQELFINNDPRLYGILVAWSMHEDSPIADFYMIQRLRQIVGEQALSISENLPEELESLKEPKRT